MGHAQKPKPNQRSIARTRRETFKALKRPSQAQRIIDKFGGVMPLVRALNEVDSDKSWQPSSIYRWTYPKEKHGTAGIIPTRAMSVIVKAARIHGIYLAPEDLYPAR